MGIIFNKASLTSNKTTVNEEVSSKFKIHFGNAAAEAINNRVKYDIIPSLGPKNFTSRAIEQLAEQKIPPTQIAIAEQANILLQEFVKAESWARYNKDTGQIEMDDIIHNFEIGSPGEGGCPVLKTITRSVEDVTENHI